MMRLCFYGGWKDLHVYPARMNVSIACKSMLEDAEEGAPHIAGIS